MSTNRVEGAIDKGVGATKEALGKATGNEKLEDLLNDVLSSTEQLHSLGGKKSEGELQ